LILYLLCGICLGCLGLLTASRESEGTPVELKCGDGRSLPGSCVALTSNGDVSGVSRRTELPFDDVPVDAGVYVDNYGNSYKVTLFRDFTVLLSAP